jgi:RNA polymerase sigma-70 factor, ECF subfamily
MRLASLAAPARNGARSASRAKIAAVADDADATSASARSASLEGKLTAVATGDRGAFAALYDQLVPRVLGLTTRLLRDRAQAEEVTQEVFLEVWQQAARYDPSKGGATTWVLTMAHRRAVDRVRSSQAGRDRDTRIGIRDWSPDYDSVSEAAEIRVENERVKAALGRLTDLQRQAVTLAYYGGFSHSEVAEILHVPLGTVKTRLRDGMIRLRDEMGVAT